MNTLKTVFDKITDKTELASHKIDLGTIDDIAYQFKTINKTNDDFNKLDAVVQKNFAALNTAYKQIVLNKDYEKKVVSLLDKLQAAITKQATDLGLNPKDLPAYKQLMDCYSLANQVNDSIVNSMDVIKTLGK
jgi:hypothetical protein